MNSVHLKSDRERGGVPFAALRAFEAAATLGSFKAAGADLGLTASAISHHVRDLEATLGEQLFERRHRGVALTPAGERLAGALRPAFRQITTAYRSMLRDPVRLRLSAAPLFASRYILPNIDALNALRPGVSFSVASTLERTDVSRDLQSMALYFGPEPANVQAIEVAVSGFVVIAAPGLGRTLAAKPDALASAPLLTITGRSAHWTVLFGMLGLDGPRREVLFDSIEGVLHAAEAGHGVALMPALVCGDALAAGRLMQVHPAVLDNGWRYWLTASRDGPAAKHLSAVASWLRERIARPGASGREGLA
jgi:LysR family transcriptional regulator, glycine cleavage system transcriptional activator